MRMVEIIAAKRDGGALSGEAIRTWIRGVLDGTIPDYQSAALLMAIVWRGMDTTETAALTEAMADSGVRIPVGAVPGAIDKHSTGGVGDKATLVVVPILAAAGVPVCKMSGRGLGHTGGTVDKLASIPGFQLQRTPEQMVEQALSIGACLCGQGPQLAPADGRLYALRDVTGTVNSLPLIVASILSKKLAGGAGAFLFDVKAGGGALMRTTEEALALANALVDASRSAGRRARALVTDMDQPLGRCVGNALEVREALDVLDPSTYGATDQRLRTLCTELAVEGLLLAGLPDRHAARSAVETALASGSALARFEDIVTAQGGDPRVVRDRSLLPSAPERAPLRAPRSGTVEAIDARSVGECVVALGGGRERKEDAIDPGVGVEVLAPVGATVRVGDLLGWAHVDPARRPEAVLKGLLDAFRIGETQVDPGPVVRAGIG
ncbi:MAG: thymidine phosphorylase [Armatimonadota bacterium]